MFTADSVHLLYKSATYKWLTSSSYRNLRGLGHPCKINLFLFKVKTLFLLWLPRNSAALSNLIVNWAIVMCYLIPTWLNNRSFCCMIRRSRVQVVESAHCKCYKCRAVYNVLAVGPILSWILLWREFCSTGLSLLLCVIYLLILRNTSVESRAGDFFQYVSILDNCDVILV